MMHWHCNELMRRTVRYLVPGSQVAERVRNHSTTSVNVQQVHSVQREHRTRCFLHNRHVTLNNKFTAEKDTDNYNTEMKNDDKIAGKRHVGLEISSYWPACFIHSLATYSRTNNNSSNNNRLKWLKWISDGRIVVSSIRLYQICFFLQIWPEPNLAGIISDNPTGAEVIWDFVKMSRKKDNQKNCETLTSTLRNFI